MESIQHIKTYKYFDVPDEDFDKFQELFSKYEPRSGGEAVYYVSDEIFSRKYTAYEIKSIFEEDCRLSGRDKEMTKNSIVDYSDRSDAMDELKEFIKKGKPISKSGAKTILKVMEAFEKS